MTNSLGKKTVNFDINGIAAGVNMKVLKISKPSGDVFETSACTSSTSHGLPKKPVLICPNEVVEAEDPGRDLLDESMPEPDAVPRGVAGPGTPSDKDGEAHELTHLPTQPWCSVCVSSQRG